MALHAWPAMGTYITMHHTPRNERYCSVTSASETRNENIVDDELHFLFPQFITERKTLLTNPAIRTCPKISTLANFDLFY
jgi:hypothetical protein